MINTSGNIVLSQHRTVYSKPQKTSSKPRKKSEIILHALQRKRGASLDELCIITGWQAHSIRGHISGTLRKKKKLNVSSDLTRSGTRRYRVIEECS
ncbi:DUF3489 domain-containing protein [Lentilitoribacter sp. Alg239-R112]|uniref:DUF3489 domain-containing protein n=1 Tax=Lentilitoribacter sp. Alg239-R112 TaxID=2305987 RepID=UPI0013A6DDC5|nr:DUF3489 domain-containing protein [Lentilitoribacter sp. Alg239-R112]